MRVTVLGGGVYGLAAAWGLVRRGHVVTLVDRASVLPDPLASSSDQHRLIRHAYGAAPGYTRMVSDSFAAWEAMWRDVGQRLYAETGTLILGPDAPGGYVASTEAVLRDQGVPHRRLSPAEAEAAFPVYRAGDATAALHLPAGGTLFAGDICASLATHLGERGVRFELGRTATSLDPQTASVTLDDGAAIDADRLVVAAGAWTATLLPHLAPRLEPVLQTLLYLAPPQPPSWTTAPMLLADLTREGSFYTVPPRLGRGLKAGLHVRSGRCHADTDRTPRPAVIEAALASLPAHLTDGSSYRVIEAKTCLYTVTAEERFVTERIGRTLVLSCCSGHGFKFASAIGLALASLLEGEDSFDSFRAWLEGRDDAPHRAIASLHRAQAEPAL